MAHIPDGVLSAPVLIVGTALAVAGVALALQRIDERTIPRIALASAAFFVAALIAIPIGVSSVHLLLVGLMGLTLGLGAIPAVLVGLLLQAVLFGFGGLTTLGINTINIALPGMLVGLLIGPLLARSGPRVAIGLAGLAGALGAAGTVGLVALELALTAPDLAQPAKLVLISAVPLILIETIVTACAVSFLRRVRPDLLHAQAPAPTGNALA